MGTLTPWSLHTHCAFWLAVEGRATPKQWVGHQPPGLGRAAWSAPGIKPIWRKHLKKLWATNNMRPSLGGLCGCLLLPCRDRESVQQKKIESEWRSACLCLALRGQSTGEVRERPANPAAPPLPPLVAPKYSTWAEGTKNFWRSLFFLLYLCYAGNTWNRQGLTFTTHS